MASLRFYKLTLLFSLSIYSNFSPADGVCGVGNVYNCLPIEEVVVTGSRNAETYQSDEERQRLYKLYAESSGRAGIAGPSSSAPSPQNPAEVVTVEVTGTKQTPPPNEPPQPKEIPPELKAQYDIYIQSSGRAGTAPPLEYKKKKCEADADTQFTDETLQLKKDFTTNINVCNAVFGSAGSFLTGTGVTEALKKGGWRGKLVAGLGATFLYGATACKDWAAAHRDADIAAAQLVLVQTKNQCNGM